MGKSSKHVKMAQTLIRDVKKSSSGSDGSDSDSERSSSSIGNKIKKALSSALEVLPNVQLAEQGASLILGLLRSGFEF